MAKVCIGITLTGTRCKRDALPKSNYCAIHGSGFSSRVMKKAAKKAAKKKASKKK
jgi:hypothetical protein